MSFSDGWAALHLEMPSRIPRIEFDAESHWKLVNTVLGSRLTEHSPEVEKEQARQAFAKAWNYDLRLVPLIGDTELDALRTRMGHAEYAAGGGDFDAQVTQPFTEPEDVFNFDPWEIYGAKEKAELVRRFNAHYRQEQTDYPDLVASTGTYVTLFSGLISIFGWDMMLLAGGLDPVRFGEVANRYASWMQQFYDAIAECDATLIYAHDDIVWTTGAVFHPEWYRKYIFPHYKKFFDKLHEGGKKAMFISDGNYTEFIDDIAKTGADGFFFEPLTDLKYIVEHYGKTHFMVGNVDTRALLFGSREEIRQQVERCVSLGKDCPGYFISVSNMIPANTPVESALYYNEVYEELSRR